MDLETRASAHSALAAIAVAVCFGLIATTTSSAQTINFGQNLPDGPVAPGYAGFNWGSAENDPFGGYGLTDFAASIDQFSRNQPFDLNSVTFQNLESDGIGDGDYAYYTTVISGYRGNNFVKSVTENYVGYQAPTYTGLSIDDVNKITFSTNRLEQITYCCDSGGNVVTKTVANGPDWTLVSSLTVSNFTKAPELNNSSAATALTLLLGSLAVLRGRRAPEKPRVALRLRNCMRSCLT
jgi:hypothetical protein